MTDTFPRWATLRAEEVRNVLPPEEWGAWARASGECVRSTPGVFGLTDTSHPAEPPYFYHCVRCVTSILEKAPPPKPWLRRDQGLCVRCGEPAAPVDVIRIPAAACALAEELGITVARLNTKKFCFRCNPFDKPWCKGILCRRRKRRRRVEAPGCCALTADREGKRKFRHCYKCCQNRKKSIASKGKARRTRQKEARAPETIRLQAEGLSVNEIAKKLGVSGNTVRRDLGLLD